MSAVNSGTSAAEVAHIENWLQKNNLRLNCTKTKEIIFRVKGKRGSTAEVPAPCEAIARVTTLTMLGVVINEQMTAVDHVSSLFTTCSRLLYTLRVLRNHGIPAASMSDVFRATVIDKLTYSSLTWAGFTSAADQARLDAFFCGFI